MPLAACITAVLLNCSAMPAHKADRLPRKPRAEPIHRIATPSDVEARSDGSGLSPETTAPAFGLSPDEVVAYGFQEIAIYTPPEPEPEQRSAEADPQPAPAGSAGGLPPDQMVAIGFQDIAIYSPPEPEPEKLSRRERRKQEKAERRARRRDKRQDKPVETEVVTTKVKEPVLAYAKPELARPEPAGRRSLFAGIFSNDPDGDEPGFAPSAGGGYTAVKYEAQAQHVPEKLALSIARIESNGSCGAQSSANAIGVMQIKHATAQMIGYTGTAKGLKNCKTSAKWGVKYLAMCLDLADGDVKKAALCYNQGHGTLTNKRKYGKRVDRAEAKGYIAKMKAQGWRL
jgi:soluble lytic murein transglycosylase-like protein